MLILTLGAILSLAPAPATPDSLKRDLDSFPLQRSPRGTDDHIKGLLATEALLMKELTAIGYTPEPQEVKWALPAQPKEGAPPPQIWHNISIELAGKDPSLASEVLILGAHFDAVPASPGADDNGSGVAALLHIARALKPLHLKRTVRLVFFNLEEVGCIGSFAYTNSYVAEFLPTKGVDEKSVPAKRKLIGMVSLESIGFYSDAPDSQKSPIAPIKDVFEPPTVGNFLSICGVAAHQSFSRRLAREMTAAEPLCITFLADFFPIPIPDIMRSDHGPFIMKGLPAVMLTDTANFRNANYHKATDTIDTLDLTRLAHATNALTGATIAIAEEIPTPAK